MYSSYGTAKKTITLLLLHFPLPPFHFSTTLAGIILIFYIHRLNFPPTIIFNKQEVKMPTRLHFHGLKKKIPSQSKHFIPTLFCMCPILDATIRKNMV